MVVRIREDDLSGSEITALLREHLDDMHAITPPESVHAMDITALRGPGVTFWTAWEGGELLGCGALKTLDATTGEIKSMRTSVPHRGRGVARALLSHIIQVARSRGHASLYLETGSMAEFAPARALYEQFGFSYCEPFGDYVADPNSVFMKLALQ